MTHVDFETVLVLKISFFNIAQKILLKIIVKNTYFRTFLALSVQYMVIFTHNSIEMTLTIVLDHIILLYNVPEHV